MKSLSPQAQRVEVLPQEDEDGTPAELHEDIVIVGGGIAGLATALGLHRCGFKSLVLERSESLRTSGTSINMWRNAWQALRALGVPEDFRDNYVPIERVQVFSKSGELEKDIPLGDDSKWKHEQRCVERKALLEELAKPLPSGTIRFNSKVSSIQEGSKSSLSILYLEDGTTISTKVLIGCDGVHSVVSKWLGLPEPTQTGRWSIRGLAVYPEGHPFPPSMQQYIGEGIRAGFIPVSSTKLYWFVLYARWPHSSGAGALDSERLRQVVLSSLEGFPDNVREAIRRAPAEDISASSIWLRWLGPELEGRLSRGGATVAGDAMHPMTPDIGQGGCCALEDAVVLARWVGWAMARVGAKARQDGGRGGQDEEEMRRIEEGLKRYREERMPRASSLTMRAFEVAKMMDAFKRPANIDASTFVAHTQFECGTLHSN